MPKGKPPKNGFKKGHPRFKGRQKGTKNKFTNLKEAFIEAFKSMNSNPSTTLEKFAKHPLTQKDFLKMIANMLPKEMTLKGDADAPLIINFDKTDEKL